MTRPGALTFALLGLLAAPARADERITDYASDIRVSETGALTVTETISVIADGDQIRHGIFRVIPTEYTDRLGKTVRVGFDALSATRDDHPEPFSVDSVDDGQRIKIGDKDVLIDPGRHVYTLTYATDRQIGFFADYDELYWNVTGNFWKFPIDHAEATIELPPGARIKQYTAYTGAVGAAGHNAEADKLHDGDIRFSTTQPLDIGEGLTVAVGFSKGAGDPADRGGAARPGASRQCGADRGGGGDPDPADLFLRRLVDAWPRSQARHDHPSVRAAEGFLARRGALRPPHGL